LEDAEAYLLEGSNLCERLGIHSFGGAANCFRGEAYFEKKEYQKSRECYDQARRFFRWAPIWPSYARLADLGMARCSTLLGERNVDLEFLRATFGKNRIKEAEGLSARYLGEILMNLGVHEAEAEQWIWKAIETDESHRMPFHVGRDYALYAEFFRRQGDRPKAQENLGKAIDILRQCGADGWVQKYEKEMAALR
jgi:tetratricopeptide (TPR) repeat protein